MSLYKSDKIRHDKIRQKYLENEKTQVNIRPNIFVEFCLVETLPILTMGIKTQAEVVYLGVGQGIITCW